MFFFEANTPIEYNIVVEMDVVTGDIKRYTLPFPAWSMCLNPINNDVYALGLDGQVCQIKTSVEELQIHTVKLSFPDKELKSSFPTINFVASMVVVVAYLKTNKEDDSCPNRLFLLTPELQVTGTVDINLTGKIFCKLA